MCLPCWRNLISMVEDPPAMRDESGKRLWPEEICDWCKRRTNNGIYWPREAV